MNGHDWITVGCTVFLAAVVIVCHWRQYKEQLWQHLTLLPWINTTDNAINQLNAKFPPPA